MSGKILCYGWLYNLRNGGKWLGWLFLAIVGAIIDMKNGKLTFEIWQEKVEFNVFKLTKQPLTINSYCRVYVTKKCIKGSI